MSAKVRVLLLWPGSEGAAAGNFGVPQLVLLGTYLRVHANVEVEIRDLAVERAFGQIDFTALLAGDGRGYDIIAFSVYSSFDWLKCKALGELARAQWPDAVLVTGGYHASARPLEMIAEDSPFDVAVVGEGERPLVTIVDSVRGGAPLRKVVLGPDAIDDLDTLPPSDWSLLSRYRSVARKVASQAQVYLSRGCPFDCAFCMERAKRETSWRPLSVERAVEEIVALHQFLDLRTWTLYFGDALFGMRKSWRRKFLEELARRDIPVDKYWLLIRVDMVDDEDLRLFSAANCGLGFGLESGDPRQLATIRKSGRLDDYLDRMEHISERAREHDVPWGANIICGHPGETEQTMRTSAAYMRKLFLNPRGVTGFLSVDPFRLYPGSPIDAERGHYERTYGTRFHYPQWWDEGDPEFLSEWVDPSAELTWSRREALQDELLSPVLASIEGNFVYRGKAREYFLRAVRDQIAFGSASRRMHDFGRYYAWMKYTGRGRQAAAERSDHAALTECAETLRRAVLPHVAAQVGVESNQPVLESIAVVPRERFVPLDEVATSVRDQAIALDDGGLATVSAMHAYARSFDLLGVGPGDRVLDLGAGSGYGTAILADLVGATGNVVGVEIDPALVAAASLALDGTDVAQVVVGDAVDPATWPDAARACTKVTVGFGLVDVPDAWFDALGEDVVIVAPLGSRESQHLVRVRRTKDGIERETFDAVRYVPVRRSVAPRTVRVEAPPPAPAPSRHLPVVD
jgi:protein-L-isoaspartate(D-aspartate) O-methyltransferase